MNYGGKVRVVMLIDINEAMRSLTIETWRNLSVQPNTPVHGPKADGAKDEDADFLGPYEQRYFMY
jgi:hypothetical protein